MVHQPPWVDEGYPGKRFTVPEIENVPDLHGEIVDPQLVVFFGGNQFMVTYKLIKAFQEEHPHYERIYWQTLPPGIMAEQIEQGALVIGNLRIRLYPDIFTAGKERIQQLNAERGWFRRTLNYAANELGLMVAAGNPSEIRRLTDLSRPDVRVSMPNPDWEGIGKKIMEAYRKAGGEALVREIMEEKVKTRTTFLTHIHHRQTPLRIMADASDVGPVWKTEILFQKQIDSPIEGVEIPVEQNIRATYTAASLQDASHPQAAQDFLDFLESNQTRTIYQDFGFLPPEEQ